MGQPSKCRSDQLSSFGDVFGNDDLRELSFFGIRENSVQGAVHLSVPGAPFMEHRARYMDPRINFGAGGIPIASWEYGGVQMVEGGSMPYVVTVRTS
jgi:hypothetical protein